MFGAFLYFAYICTSFKLREYYIMEHSLKDITAVVNHKGGVGKTSTVLSIAGGLLRENKNLRVLLIDLDSQCSLSTQCEWNPIERKGQPTVFDSLCKEGSEKGIPVYKSENGYYYSPASEDSLAVERDLLVQDLIPQGVLFNRFAYPVDDHTGDGLTTVEESFDYILIDCPPELKNITGNAIVAASRVLIPTMLNPMSYEGLSKLLKKQTKLDLNFRKLLLGQSYELQEVVILPTMTESKTRVERCYKEEVQDSYGEFLSKVSIRRDVKVQEGQGVFKDIFRYSPHCRAAIDYTFLIKELYNL